MANDVRVYLAHILECVDKIERFTAEGRDGFLRDPMVQDARHQYAGVDVERVWAVVEHDLPHVRKGIGSLVPRMEELKQELARETPLA